VKGREGKMLDLLNNGNGECRETGEIKPKAERESCVLCFNF